MKRNRVFNIRILFMLLVLLLEAAVIVAFVAIFSLLDWFFDFMDYIPAAVWLLVFGIVLGLIIATIVYSMFCAPIINISRAMKKVAEGNFDMELDTKSYINEVQDIYSSFNLMVKELRATEILQTDFVSNVSHEFKTPINAIEGYAMLLQDPQCTSEDKENYSQRILFNTRRLSNLVGNILLLSKVENQTIQTREQKYRLDEQIRQAIVMLEPKWTEKEIELDVELEEAYYLGDESLMFHVWMNLIENAIKFDPQGGEIRMKLEKQEKKILFTIEDNGPGISEQGMKHIFHKFYQDDSSHKSAGNGLGLALVKQILDISGGSIFVENIPSGGSRFVVKLPEVKNGKEK